MKNGDQPAFANKPYPEFADDFKNGFKANSGINPTGLTKREYFAAMAMQGMLSNPEYTNQLEVKARKERNFDMNKMLVLESIDMADELIKQLES